MKAILLLLLPILFAGCQHTQPQFTAVSPAPANALKLTPITFTNRIDPTWLKAPSELFTLGPGDKLDIEFMGETNTLTSTVVGPDGKVYFNLLPGMDVWGLTLAQTKAQFERELAKYVRQQPQVSLVLRGVESKRVWVLGRVTEPGVFPLAAPMTVLEAISMAGGVMSMSSFRQQDVAGISDDLADLDRSFVLRQGRLLPVDFKRLLRQGDLSQNIYLQPDDFLYFPGATVREVYVLGAVSQPRPVAYKDGLTVAGAVASAYGTITGAYLNHVAVVRGSLSNPQIAIVDYKKVIRGEAPDMALQPRDIVYVPFSPYRYLYRYAQLIVDTFVSSAAINLGSSWIGQPTGGAGVFIPVGTGSPGTPAVAPPPIH